MRRAWWGCAALLTAACSVEQAPAPWFEAPLGSNVARDQYLVELEEVPSALGGWRSRLSSQHRSLEAALREREVEHEVLHEFSTLWNGLSVWASAEQLEKLRRVPGVKAVYPVLKTSGDELPEPDAVQPSFGGTTQPELFTALQQTGVDVAQSSLGLTGAGLRVAIVDTGTDFTNPDLGGCFGPGCRVGFGYDFVGDGFDSDNPLTQPRPDAIPNDCRGHGTHVAGMIMANGRVRGVAPGVTLGSYRVFGCTGSTTNDLLIAGIERAVADGARIVNISLGNPFCWPQYPTAAAASAARSLGVIVTSSQGNNGGGGLYASSAPGVGDDVISAASVDNSATAVAAFTVSPDALRVGYEPSDTAPPPPLTGTFPVAGMPSGNALACSPLTAGSLTGQVALIPRGTCSFTQKAQNAQAAGAVAVVFTNNTGGNFQINVTGVTIPAVMVTQADGATIAGRLGAGVSLTWGSSITTPRSTGGQVSGFSSFGPSPELGLKPDVLTPGGGIYSTWLTTQGSWATISGTSMSGAYLAGVSALLLQAQPTLTPAELGDLLRNTAVPVRAGSSQNLEPIVRQGAGLARVDVAAQTRVRVTPSKLSLGESQGQTSFTRLLTVTNRGSSELVFTLSHAPSLSVIGNSYTPTATPAGQAQVAFSAQTLTVPAGGAASVSVTITPNSMLPVAGLYGGWVVFTSGPTVLRVPYLGFSGDYQTMTVINAPDAGPYLARGPGPAFTPLPDGGVFTLAGTDTPTVVVHLDHFSRTFALDAIDADTGKPWGTFFSMEYVGKDYTATAWQRVQWDGFTTFDKRRALVPNGRYRIQMTVLKAMGDAGTPSDVERWVSPAFTLNHP
ncbi:MAG: S8 family serine peptidase [Myxococcaceae bacterium]|nr:S8 family serine peptidase [Myxococcaceae bacterium]